jgi:hypothetical protein
MNKAALAQMLASKEWKQAMEIFDRHIGKEIDTDGLDMEEVGKRFIAHQEAENAFKNAKAELEMLSREIEKKEISYK